MILKSMSNTASTNNEATLNSIDWYTLVRSRWGRNNKNTGIHHAKQHLLASERASVAVVVIVVKTLFSKQLIVDLLFSLQWRGLQWDQGFDPRQAGSGPPAPRQNLERDWSPLLIRSYRRCCCGSRSDRHAFLQFCWWFSWLTWLIIDTDYSYQLIAIKKS